ncbi:protein SRC2-like [Cornus florida]|uniref:protein SRC2-like n=1 Tax=Cornus florida TaxID=4283 RepID=UPI002896486C|nr:protein SRC2-like [Cornus florida]
MGCCIKPRTQADMVCTEFEINLISAKNLKDGKVFSRKVYARVSIGGGTEKQSWVDTNNGTNPSWHFNTIHTIDESSVQNPCTMLVIKLYSQRWIGDRYIGEVHVSLKELKDQAPKGSNTVDYKVKKGSEYSQGTLKFSYRFGGTMKADDDDEKPISCKRALHGAVMLAFSTSLNFLFGIPI